MQAKTVEMGFRVQKDSLVGPDPEETKVLEDLLEGNINLVQNVLLCIVFTNNQNFNVSKPYEQI